MKFWCQTLSIPILPKFLLSGPIRPKAPHWFVDDISKYYSIRMNRAQINLSVKPINCLDYDYGKHLGSS